MLTSTSRSICIVAVAVFGFCLSYTLAEKIAVEKDLPYVKNGANDQQLDLYLPGQSRFPTILFVHEGGLTSGDRKDPPYDKIAERFASVGIGFAVINYRLGTVNKWPTMIEDVAASFAWLKDSIEIRGGDPNRIFVVGHSSGALLAAVLSTDQRYLEKYGFALGNIAGCVSMGSMMNPSYDSDSIPRDTLKSIWERLKRKNGYESIFPTPEDYRTADPLHHVSADAPRFLILVADSERFEPPILEQAERFSREMAKVGVSVRVVVIKNRRHITAMTKMSEPEDPAFLSVVEFVKGK